MRSGVSHVVLVGFLILADAVSARIGVVAGVRPDVFLAATVCVVLYRDHAAAVTAGFLFGLLADLLQPAVFGAHALRLATVSYVFGWLHGRFNEDMPHVQAAMVAAASVLGILVTALEASVVSMPFGYSWRVAVSPLVDAGAGVPVILVLRRILVRPVGVS